MQQVRALVLVIALAATACSSDSDTASPSDTATEDKSSTTTDAPAAPVTEQIAAETEIETEPASTETTEIAETSEDPIVIESDFNFETQTGSFVVDEGAELLGCSSGSLWQRGGPQGVTNTFTCEDGDREGTFTFNWTIVDGAKGPGQDNGPWSVLAATGDFVSLAGDGLGSGVIEGDVGRVSFPGAIGFGPVEAVAEADSAIVTDLTAYVDAFFTDDTEGAWNTVSERCKAVIDEVEHDGWVAELTLAAPGASVSNISTVVDGDTAAVTYYVFAESGELFAPYFAQPWVLADGEWFWDAC